MYNLGDNFKIPTFDVLPKEECVYKGEYYRFTILSERLIRLEYNPDGIFEDRPTEFAWNREFPVPKFAVKEDKRYFELKTSYFTLTYTKNKSFKGSSVSPSSNLKVEVTNSDRYWYYGHQEIRNYGASGNLLDSKHNIKGLYSIDGFASFNDSNTSVFNENGELVERESKGIDIYLFVYLKDYDLALKDYFMLTGKPSLIPRYALGNWWSKNETYNEFNIKNLVEEFELNKIPMSILLLDKDWHKRLYQGKNHLKTGFTFDNKLFPNPGDLVKFLNSKGIRLGLNINPIPKHFSPPNTDLT